MGELAGSLQRFCLGNLCLRPRIVQLSHRLQDTAPALGGSFFCLFCGNFDRQNGGFLQFHVIAGGFQRDAIELNCLAGFFK